MNKLQAGETSSKAISVRVTKMEAGSVIVTAVIFFPGDIAPPVEEVREVLTSDDTLTDGNITISFDPDSIFAEGNRF